MDEERLERALWAEADGTLSAAERAELERLRASSPDVSALERELRVLSAELRSVESVEPPADLARVVARALDERERKAAARRSRPLAWLRDLFAAGAPRAAWAAAGAVAALLVVVIVTGSSPFGAQIEDAEIWGSMVPDLGPAETTRLESAAGTIELSGDAERLYVDVRLAAGAGDSQLQIRGARLVLVGARVQGVDSTTLSIDAEEIATTAVGAGELALVVEPQDLAEVLTVRLAAAGEPIMETEVRLDSLPTRVRPQVEAGRQD